MAAIRGSTRALFDVSRLRAAGSRALCRPSCPGLLPLRALLLARLPWRAASCRLLVVSRAAGDAKLPASFVAPVTVNMDDYPPPRRRLSKGTAWRGVSLFADALHVADDVVVQFVRSGGAGGQNVNKGALLLHPGVQHRR